MMLKQNGAATRLTKRPAYPVFMINEPWWRRLYWMRWGVDIKLRRSWLTIAWRPSFAVWWSPDATPQHDKARRLIGEAW